MSATSETCPVSLTGSAADSFLFLINTLMASQCLFDTKSQYPPNHKFKPWESFDYIVVGSGSAGAVVASRLAENPELRILLIEAGEIPSPNTEIPGFMLENFKSDINWYDEMEPNKICKAATNQKCRYSRGKVLGGSSIINGMVYVRGNKKDFEEWEEFGNENWDWDTVTEYFKKSQGLQEESLKSNTIYGTEGPLITTLPTVDQDLTSLIFETAREMNQTVSKDAVFKGYYESLSTINNGIRCSTAKAFLSNEKSRNNLFIATGVYVEKLIIEKSSMAAKGVVVRTQKNSFNIFVKNEIILSAGVIGSPLILQKSGIGPRSIIPNPILELPVGENFQDHIAFQGLLIGLEDEKLSNRRPMDFLEIVFRYFSKQEGPLASSGTVNLLGFINTQDANSEYPNIQLHHYFYPKGSSNINFLLDGGVEIDESTKTNLREYFRNSDILLILPVLIKPKSRGFVKFRPDSIKPFIQPNYLNHEDDMKSLLGAIRYVQDFIKTKIMKDRNAELINFDHPCKNGNEIDWECFIKFFSFSDMHGVGTCRMAKKELGGVVDDKLRVYGIKNLRIADASIMPTITSGNTHIPTIMIGERLADFILQDLNLSKNH